MKRNLKILTGAILLFTLAVQTAVAAPYTGKLLLPINIILPKHALLVRSVLQQIR